MKKVLVVDDNLDMRNLYKLALEREGLKVIEAESGQEALFITKTTAVDLVLLDIMMPNMNGYQVCRRLRADPQTAHLPILMLSAKSTPADRRNGLLAGANDFLVKTIGTRQLAARVQTLLSDSLSYDGSITIPVPGI